MLKTPIPSSLWEQTKSLICHPGIRGDRGPASLDYALLQGKKEWGVTIVEADHEMDAGAIWDS